MFKLHSIEANYNLLAIFAKFLYICCVFYVAGWRFCIKPRHYYFVCIDNNDLCNEILLFFHSYRIHIHIWTNRLKYIANTPKALIHSFRYTTYHYVLRVQCKYALECVPTNHLFDDCKYGFLCLWVYFCMYRAPLFLFC